MVFLMNHSNISNEANQIYTILPGYDLSINDLTIIGLLLTIISLLITVVVYRIQTVKTRKIDKIKERKENLKTLITVPNPDFKYSGFYYPPGGHIENEENEQAALIREVNDSENSNI